LTLARYSSSRTTHRYWAHRLGHGVSPLAAAGGRCQRPRSIARTRVAALSPSDAVVAIGELAGRLPRGPVYVFLGGDNAITFPLLAGLAGDRLDRAGIITLDAHHDVRTTEAGPSNGSPIRGLIEAGLPEGHVAQVGISLFSNSAAYRAFCDEHAFLIVTMDSVFEWGIEEAVNLALEHLSDRCDWIYVDLDLDVLDRAFAPGCPGSRPGGMTPRQLATAARICGRHPKVQAADLVEVDPLRDHDGLTLMAMATTFLSFAAGVAERPGARNPEAGLPGRGTRLPA